MKQYAKTGCTNKQISIFLTKLKRPSLTRLYMTMRSFLFIYFFNFFINFFFAIIDTNFTSNIIVLNKFRNLWFQTFNIVKQQITLIGVHYTNGLKILYCTRRGFLFLLLWFENWIKLFPVKLSITSHCIDIFI